MNPSPHGEAADQVDQPPQRRRLGATAERDHPRHRLGIEQVGPNQLEPVARLDPLELALDDPWHDHAPPIVEKAPDDRGPQASRASGDDRRGLHQLSAGHSIFVMP